MIAYYNPQHGAKSCNCRTSEYYLVSVYKLPFFWSSFLRKQESSLFNAFWIPGQACLPAGRHGMTE